MVANGSPLALVGVVGRQEGVRFAHPLTPNLPPRPEARDAAPVLHPAELVLDPLEGAGGLLVDLLPAAAVPPVPRRPRHRLRHLRLREKGGRRVSLIRENGLRLICETGTPLIRISTVGVELFGRKKPTTTAIGHRSLLFILASNSREGWRTTGVASRRFRGGGGSVHNGARSGQASTCPRRLLCKYPRDSKIGIKKYPGFCLDPKGAGSTPTPPSRGYGRAQPPRSPTLKRTLPQCRSPRRVDPQRSRGHFQGQK